MTGPAEPTFGELVNDVSENLTKLVRQELELAKVEIQGEVKHAAKGAGMLGGAGFAGYFALLFLSVAAIAGLAHVMDTAWASLIVAGIWIVGAGVLALGGKRQLGQVGAPTNTIETLKEDAQWARHPTSSGQR